MVSSCLRFAVSFINLAHLALTCPLTSFLNEAHFLKGAIFTGFLLGSAEFGHAWLVSYTCGRQHRKVFQTKPIKTRAGLV